MIENWKERLDRALNSDQALVLVIMALTSALTWMLIYILNYL